MVRMLPFQSQITSNHIILLRNSPFCQTADPRTVGSLAVDCRHVSLRPSRFFRGVHKASRACVAAQCNPLSHCGYCIYRCISFIAPALLRNPRFRPKTGWTNGYVVMFITPFRMIACDLEAHCQGRPVVGSLGSNLARRTRPAVLVLERLLSCGNLMVGWT